MLAGAREMAVGARRRHYIGRQAAGVGVGFEAMSDPLTRMTTRVAYVATQFPRLAWYAGHDYVMRRLAAQVRHDRRRSRANSEEPARREGVAKPHPEEPSRSEGVATGRAVAVRASLPDLRRIYADLARLMA